MQEIFDNAQIFNEVDSLSQPDDYKVTGKRPPWRDERFDKVGVTPQSDLIVTHVNQTLDLQQAKQFAAVPSKSQTSSEWLSNHSLEYEKLTLKDILQSGKQVKNAGERQHLVFDSTFITEKEYKLNLAIEEYHKRVKWLLNGSKKLFGLVKGSRVGVVIDSSNANTGFGRLEEFQQSLLNLIDEQLRHKKSLFILSFGTEPESLWNHAMDVNLRTLEESRDFIRGLHSSGGCNILKAFKKIIKVKKINSILIILGNCPDQTSTVLFDYVQQCLLGKKIPIHAVAYDTSNHLTHETLQKLAEFSNGRYHCYNSSNDREVYKSFDIQLLLREAQRAVDVISKIKQMRTGMLGDALISIESEISLEVDRLSTARFLPRPPNHHRPLSVETPNFHPCTSIQWINENGLRANNLNLYQILAPNAFDPVQDFIPILRKSVGSKIHGKAMQQFEWHDGSVKNVHVDIAMLYEYQRQLGSAVKTFERRIEWLASGSRKIWGTVTEQRVIVLVDMSISNKAYVIHIQHSLRLLLEQQVANKQAFNIVAFGSHPKMWKPNMVKPTLENLQSAWKWILNLEALGSRNLLSAFRAAVENDEDIKNFGEPQGVYLISSGVPDQEEDVLCSFVSETCIGSELKIHTILFNIDDYIEDEKNLPSRYATVPRTADYLRNLAHCGGGRLHWFKETGIVESDDILLISYEMEKAIHYSKRCSTLVESVRLRDEKRRGEIAAKKQLMICGEGASNHPKDDPPRLVAFIEPRPTALTLARMKSLKHTRALPFGENNSTASPMSQSLRNLNTSGRNEKEVSTFTRDNLQEDEHPKVLAWKAPSKKAILPAASSSKLTPTTATTKGRRSEKPYQQAFYTEDSNSVGVVYKKYPKQKSVRKAVPEPILPKTEELLTSKQWLRKYGINRLKLNLNKYVAGPVCVHEKARVKGTNTTAKWFCSIFPSVEIEDTIRHIDMQESEINDYIHHVTTAIRRYSKRLQWLLSGSRRLFGSIVEKNVVVLIDVSGSMGYYLEELQRELTSLIWEQFRAHKIIFNLVSFSNECKKWQEGVTEANETTCHDAVQWAASLRAHGGTATLEALQVALSDEDADAIYLITDGKPDTSARLTLEKVKEMNKKKIPIHSVSFNCDDNGANKFMKILSSMTGGRYHHCHGEPDAQLAIHRLVDDGCLDEDDPNLPNFQGDDLKRIANEINKARKFLTQASYFRQVIVNHSSNTQKPTNADTKPTSKRVSDRPFYP